MFVCKLDDKDVPALRIATEKVSEPPPSRPSSLDPGRGEPLRPKTRPTAESRLPDPTAPIQFTLQSLRSLQFFGALFALSGWLIVARDAAGIVFTPTLPSLPRPVFVTRELLTRPPAILMANWHAVT